jgi:hypothetical protein
MYMNIHRYLPTLCLLMPRATFPRCRHRFSKTSNFCQIWLPKPIVPTSRFYLFAPFQRENGLYYYRKKRIRRRIVGSLGWYRSSWAFCTSSLVFHSCICDLLKVSLNGRILPIPKVLHSASFKRLT